MIFLITGATGLVGNKIIDLCETQKIKVNFLSTSRSKLNKYNYAKGFYWNPAEGIIDANAFEGVTHIIHLAGAYVAKRWTPEYKKKIFDSRINTANILFETLSNIEHSVEYFISASATGIYPSSDIIYYNEDIDRNYKDFSADIVEKWEEMADKFKLLNLKVTKVRIGIVLSKKGGALPRFGKPIKYGLGTAFGTGKQWQSWIHISDLAHLFIYIAKKQLSGVYNATAPNPVTQQKLIETCAKVLKRPLWLPNIPEFIVKLIFGEMSELILSSHRVSSRRIQEKGFIFQYPTIEVAIKDIYKKK